jgi:hypothetical protein
MYFLVDFDSKEGGSNDLNRRLEIGIFLRCFSHQRLVVGLHSWEGIGEP